MNPKTVTGYRKPCSIWPVTESDDPVIANIIRVNLQTYHLDIPGTAYFDPELDHLSRYYALLPDKRKYFIAEDGDGHVIGGAGIAEFAGFDNCAELQKLYAADSAKGNGIGKRLMLAAEDWACQAGYRRLYLETHSNLNTATGMYERNGYRQIEKPESVLHPTMDRFYIKEL